jgi:hypothetical protein
VTYHSISLGIVVRFQKFDLKYDEVLITTMAQLLQAFRGLRLLLCRLAHMHVLITSKVSASFRSTLKQRQ